MTYINWELRKDLDPVKCLQFGSKDDLGEYMIDLEDIIILSDDNGACDMVVYENESIYEQILEFIRVQGFTSGEFEQ